MATWTSSDTTKATVNSSGLVTGVGNGYVTITATVGNISGSKVINVFRPTPSPPLPLSQSVTYQIDYAHSGRAVFPGPLSFPENPTWSVTLNGAIFYPLIVDGKVFVTTASPLPGGAQYGSTLYALNEQTGQIIWGPITVPQTYYPDPWSGIAYDNGKIFVISGEGLLSSFDAATGQAGWSTHLDQSSYTAAPTAVNGIVYVGGAGSGGTLYAVNETNGQVLWSNPVANGDISSPTVSNDGVSFPTLVKYISLIPSRGPFFGIMTAHAQAEAVIPRPITMVFCIPDTLLWMLLETPKIGYSTRPRESMLVIFQPLRSHPARFQRSLHKQAFSWTPPEP